jgi:hypothetical protein
MKNRDRRLIVDKRNLSKVDSEDDDEPEGLPLLLNPT